jgi:hypothetical protein
MSEIANVISTLLRSDPVLQRHVDGFRAKLAALEPLTASDRVTGGNRLLWPIGGKRREIIESIKDYKVDMTIALQAHTVYLESVTQV